ncbi:hypothetical protein HDU98_000389, partial [Podochytrium sp. JEL0797]
MSLASLLLPPTPSSPQLTFASITIPSEEPANNFESGLDLLVYFAAASPYSSSSSCCPDASDAPSPAPSASTALPLLSQRASPSPSPSPFLAPSLPPLAEFVFPLLSHRKRESESTLPTPKKCKPATAPSTSTFTCHKCPASFARNQDLTRHVTSIHDKHVLFVCPGCPGTRFSRKDALKRHIRTF